MKIYIFGCSGSGKTYLANALAAKYQIPHLDLDDIFWDNNNTAYGIKRTSEKRDSLLEAFLTNEHWIIEGVYYKWTEPAYSSADMIYVLVIPKQIYLRRIILRFIRRKLGIEQEKGGSLKSLLALIRWTDKFQQQHMPAIQKLLIPHQKKVRIITTVKEVQRIIEENNFSC